MLKAKNLTKDTRQIMITYIVVYIPNQAIHKQEMHLKWTNTLFIANIEYKVAKQFALF